MKYKPDICFYHSPCADGFAAAYAIWTKWPDIEFIPINHGDPIDRIKITGKDVLFVDFSVKRDVMLDLATFVNTLVVLDHHASAERELKGFNNFDGSLADLNKVINRITESIEDIFVHFDMNHSGAVLAWNFANPTKEVPIAFSLIEDRDLWNWVHDATKPFTLALTSEPNDFKHWHGFVVPQWLKLYNSGRAIEKYQQTLIEQIALNAYVSTLTCGEKEYHGVVFCNSGVLQSEVGNYLINHYPDAPFAAVWYTTPDGDQRYSLRSEEGRTDVSLVASSFGGGGHRNASGFTIKKG